MKTWLPQPRTWGDLTVEHEEEDVRSFLSLYRTMLDLRRSLPALASSELYWLSYDTTVIAFSRGDGFACVVNFGAEPIELPIHEEVLPASEVVDDGTLAPDVAVWLRLPAGDSTRTHGSGA